MKNLSKLSDKDIVPIKVKMKDGTEELLGFHIRHYKIADYLFRCMVGVDEEGWEHVSVTLHKIEKKALKEVKRTPTWQEMCFIKDTFWGEEDEVIQFHPKKSEYMNVHDFCLHLWKKKSDSKVVVEVGAEVEAKQITEPIVSNI